MLKQRLITAAILILFIAIVLFYTSPPVFYFITGLIALAAAWEWSHLMSMKKLSARLLYMAFILFFFVLALFLPVSFILICGFVWWLFAFFLIILYSQDIRGLVKNSYAKGVMGVFVIVPSLITINYIRNQEDGIYALLFLLVLISGADSVAYFAGKKWGKHPLILSVSPGKTVEGLLAALIFSILIATLSLWLTPIPGRQWPYGILLAFVTVIFSVIGDLFESMLKRQAGLKDSGQLLPGHGGVLDRIDSLTAAAPLFAFGAWVLGMYPQA